MYKVNCAAPHSLTVGFILSQLSLFWMCWIMGWNRLYVRFIMVWFHQRLHSVLFSVPLHLIGFFHFFSFPHFVLQNHIFPLHLSSDHAKPLIGMMVAGHGSDGGGGWCVIVGRGVSGSPGPALKRCDWIPGQVKKKNVFSKKRFVCNHQAMIVPQSPCLICHNMLRHLLTSHHLATPLQVFESNW